MVEKVAEIAGIGDPLDFDPGRGMGWIGDNWIFERKKDTRAIIYNNATVALYGITEDMLQQARSWADAQEQERRG